VIQEAKTLAQQALDKIKKARHDKHDQLRKMKADRSLRSDDYQKAHDEMEKVVKRGNEQVKSVSEGAKRVFEG
jgi:ribosome recycling factor